MDVIYGLVDLATGKAVPVKVDDDGRLVVLVQGLDGVQVNVGASVEVSNDVGNPIPVSGPLTDSQLRAAALPVAGSSIAGAAPTLPPISVSGIDPSGLKRHLRTDLEGNVGVFDATIASDGVPLPLSALARTLNYTASKVSSIDVLYGGNTYRQTLTRNGAGQVTNVSGWVKQ